MVIPLPLLEELARDAESDATKDQLIVLLEREVVEDVRIIRDFSRLSSELWEAVRRRDGYVIELRASRSCDDALRTIDMLSCMQLDDMEKAARLLLMARETRIKVDEKTGFIMSVSMPRTSNVILYAQISCLRIRMFSAWRKQRKPPYTSFLSSTLLGYACGTKGASIGQYSDNNKSQQKQRDCIKRRCRRRRDLFSDGVKNLATTSGRGRLKEDLESYTWRRRQDHKATPSRIRNTFEARVQDYMAAHTERMKRFKNAIFKQREKINDMMAEMFGLLKELTTSRAPEKVLIREEAKSPVTKNVNSISLFRGEKERNNDNDVETRDDAEKPTITETGMPVNEAENGIKNEPIKKAEKEEAVKAPSSQPIKENEKRPFILGTPFLTTAKAVIKFDKGTITLRFRKSKVSFNMIPESLCKDEKGIKNDIDPIAPTMTINRLVLEWEEKINLH
nr:hypothetical protein [Tanacetum cinerariifolium]